MKKLILFDWANVLLDCYSGIYGIYDAQRDIARALRPDRPTRLAAVFADDRYWTMCGGRLDSVISEYLCRSGSGRSVSDFKKVYLQFYRKVPWFNCTISLAGSLAQRKDISTGILSTLCEEDIKLLESHLPLQKFDHLFFSCKMGVQKPDKRIYHAVMESCGCRPEDILFIDDRAENTARAEDEGWHVLTACGNEYSRILSACRRFINGV